MTDFLLLAFLFLVAGVVAVPLASRFRLGSVLGYLIAGIAISPLLSLLQVDIVSIQHFAEFGVVMMLFLVGLELEPKRLWSMRLRLFGMGGGQIGLTAVGIMVFMLLLGQPWSVALAVGLVLALSSTAIVLQTLAEKGLMKSEGGQSGFSVLLFQDITVIPMLALIPLLAMPQLQADHSRSDGGHGVEALSLVSGLPGWAAALVTLAAIAAVIGVGNYLTGPIIRFISAAKLRELFVATALLFVIGIALLMSLVGISPALGTFLAGVVLANSEYRHELESDIDPFKALLLGLFFMTVGASINFEMLFSDFGIIVGLTFGLLTLKAIVLFGLATLFGIRGSDRWLLSLGLAQAGEFGFVLLSLTVSNAVIPDDLAQQLSLIVALSMLLTPLLFVAQERILAPRFVKSDSREMDTIDQPSHIIIAGHGRFGGIVSRILRGMGLSPTVIDHSSDQIELLKSVNVQSYFGDATRPDLLKAAGVADARLILIAIDDRNQITALAKYVSRHHPKVHIIARAVDRDHVYELNRIGCADIIRECYDSSLRMAQSAIEAQGLTRQKAGMIVDAFDQLDRANLVAAAAKHDPSNPSVNQKSYTHHLSADRNELDDQLKRRLTAIVEGS